MILQMKRRKKVLALMLTIAALMARQTAMAQGLYTATDGTGGANASEWYGNLLDGDTGTKWCVTDFEPFNDPIYVEFKTKDPIVPKGYTLTTANDTKDYSERNPSSWKILAKNDGDTGWTTLADVEDDTTLGEENYKPYDFSIINKNDSSYQYFRFEVSQLQGYDNYEKGIFQLSEFSFILKKDAKDLYQSTVEGLQAEYYYTGTAIDMSSFAVKDADGETIAPSKYTCAIQDVYGNDVTEVITPGMYRLVISPSSSSDYTSQKIFSFEVYPWAEGVTAGFCGMLNDYYGKEVYYTITDEEGVRTLTIKKNPGSPEYSGFRMGDYWGDVNDEDARFAPWITADPQYFIDDNGTPDDESDDYVDYDIFDHYELSSDIQKVVIEEGVTYIGTDAFYDCSELETVIVPSTVEGAGYNAFEGTEWLDNQPDGIVYVGGLAYQRKGNDNLFENVVFKDGTLYIRDKLFSNLDNLKSVVIPASVKTIGEYAFASCENLETVTIGAGVTFIDETAFGGCQSVTDVYCYANPDDLTWDDGFGDFYNNSPKTKCHVLPGYKSLYEGYYNGNVYVDFKGDLPHPVVGKEHDGKYWATHYSSMFGYKIADAEQACAYTATFEDNTLTLHKLGSEIPAGTAVIIVSTAEDPYMYIDATATAENTVSNDLKGVDARKKVSALGEGTFYVMGKQGNDFGFFEYTGTYMPANKAYLQVESAAQVKGLRMIVEDDADSLRPLSGSPEGERSVYDLNGRKVQDDSSLFTLHSSLKKGIYIVNGKKILK